MSRDRNSNKREIIMTDIQRMEQAVAWANNFDKKLGEELRLMGVAVGVTSGLCLALVGVGVAMVTPAVAVGLILVKAGLGGALVGVTAMVGMVVVDDGDVKVERSTATTPYGGSRFRK
jgi:hypothetical protein